MLRGCPPRTKSRQGGGVTKEGEIMCKFASLVLTRDQVFWSRNSDSHETIIRDFGLWADGVSGPNILRVEIVPPNGGCESPLDRWSYRTDQDTRPSWYDGWADEHRARAALVALVADRILIAPEGAAIEGGRSVIIIGGTAKLYDTSSAVLYDASSAVLYGTSHAELHNESHATLYDTAQAVLYDAARAELYGTSHAELHDASSAVLYGTSHAELHNESRAELYYSAHAKLHDESRATLRGTSRAVLRDESQAVLYDDSSAVLYDAASAEVQGLGVAIDRRTPGVVTTIVLPRKGANK